MDIPRAEHPEPQFQRARWLNLNGRWEFCFDPGLSGEARGLPGAEGLPGGGEILVPFCPESSLSGIGDRDFHLGAWYARAFAPPEDWASGRVLLHLGAVDHDATVWVNGHPVITHSGGYTPFTCDVTESLRRGENRLVVLARDDARSRRQPSGKQSAQYASYGCYYTRTTGIWQTVWLEAVPRTFLEGVRYSGDPTLGTVLVQARLAGDLAKGTLRVTARLDGQVVGRAEAPARGDRVACALPLEQVALWEPASPTLYDVELVFEGADGSRDAVSSYLGLREVSLGGGAMRLNGRPLYQRLVLDQGFYPEGIYTAPSDEALQRDIRLSQDLGFNGARLHEKVFEPRFLYWADRLGYLVWGEFPNWGLDVHHADALAVLAPQWLEALQRDLNHPSLVGWCPLNETQRDQDPEVVRTIYRLTKAVDPTRPVIDTSGYQHVETDVYDVHDYAQDPVVFASHYDALHEGRSFRHWPETNRAWQGEPFFVSKYGGIWWNPGQADEAGWGYGGVEGRPRTEAEFLDRYRGLTETLLANPHICAFCYTQLYDVEQEVNGLYTYDRRAKFEPRLIREINQMPAAIEREGR